MSEAYAIEVLDPAKLGLVRTEGGLLSMRLGEAYYPEVLLYRAFPLSMQTRYISVRTAKGDELGIIEDLAELSVDSRAEADKELSLRYMIPRVEQVVKIKQHPGMWVWELETTMGPLKMSMRNLHEHLQPIGSDRLMLSDMDGNRCEIASIRELDAGSRKQLGRIL